MSAKRSTSLSVQPRLAGVRSKSLPRGGDRREDGRAKSKPAEPADARTRDGAEPTSPRIGRPPIEGEKRSANIIVRVTPDEQRRIRELAERAGKSTSDHVREAALRE
jgi:hypothetical protein